MGKLPLFKVFILLLFTCTVVPTHAQNEEQYIAVLLRNIGHQFLSEIGDSTSRILEVEHQENRYVLRFEKEIEFSPDQLYNNVHEVMQKHHAQQNFIVEVSTCDSHQVLHSFKASVNRDEEILSCKGRDLPLDCYEVIFTSTEPWIAHTVVEEEKQSYTPVYLLLGGGVLVLILYLFKIRNKRAAKEVLALGAYHFDLKRMKLFYKDEVIELSAIEAELLHLFVQHKNETLKREYILNEVWEDEGNYVGRTLDVFISKLRKKLENDESLKIVSVRGVGYKFVN